MRGRFYEKASAIEQNRILPSLIEIISLAYELLDLLNLVKYKAKSETKRIRNWEKGQSGLWGAMDVCRNSCLVNF